MVRSRLTAALILAAATLLGTGVAAQTTAPAKPVRAAKAQPKAPQLEARAMDLLRAMSTSLTSAKSLAFTAVTTYESPSSVGPALAYGTTSEVLLQRPDRLRVVTLGDGPASEFYYDGKTITAFAPAENLVAVAPAPSTIDAMLKQAFDNAAIYFPFADIVGADPFQALTEGLGKAFYIGQSKVVGGTTTDMVAIASDQVFIQIWIGADDKLPRKMRAVFRGDPLQLRHQVELSNWKLDPVIAAEAFAAMNAANAKKIAFAAPKPVAPARKSGKAAGAAKAP
ncbi:DUF2092 domain-containing protein [Variovorax saccharolyticus]|uniref:DUF2092 domain-containing protein n=1 Tax=Variovorax saccharolyticus TaxID=3053516 RepID=UPI002576EADA|nr:DUF2092 domain-containing protein [Variovorax sp. J31P216]MDM0028218.1 DUF2092 domain-containing protein [Variovorax sp. J31P216]